MMPLHVATSPLAALALTHFIAAWTAAPDPDTLAALHQARPVVPEHLRRYILRDMGAKDGPIRRALGLV